MAGRQRAAVTATQLIALPAMLEWLNRTTAKPVDKGAVDEMVKALWGQLPARSREQMLQSFTDEFLPKYELEIEQYYRRLSEEQSTQPSNR